MLAGPRTKGACVGAGHNVWGILNAKATGEALSELIAVHCSEQRSDSLHTDPPSPARPIALALTPSANVALWSARRAERMLATSITCRDGWPAADRWARRQIIEWQPVSDDQPVCDECMMTSWQRLVVWDEPRAKSPANGTLAARMGELRARRCLEWIAPPDRARPEGVDTERGGHEPLLGELRPQAPVRMLSLNRPG